MKEARGIVKGADETGLQETWLDMDAEYISHELIQIASRLLKRMLDMV